MSARQRAIRALVSQFHCPRGIVGSLVGWEMALRRSNRRRNRWAISLLDVQSSDRVLEIGFGPGIAIHEAVRRAANGYVAGIDHSRAMVKHASRARRAAIRDGRVDLYVAGVDTLPDFGTTFDKVLTVNSLGFWPDPVDRLIEIRSLMREAGVLAIVSQPRYPGATSKDTDRAEGEIRHYLNAAGFNDLRAERLDLTPPCTCVLAKR